MAATEVTTDPFLGTLGRQDGVEIVMKQSPTPQVLKKDNVPPGTLLVEQTDIRRTMGNISLLYILGFAMAVSHHRFNLSLDGRAPLSQSFTLQVGLVFAFLVRAFVAAATGTALLQITWRRVKKRAFTLYGIDGIFSITKDLTQFFLLELWERATLICIISIGIWVMPLASIVPPSTLVIEPGVYETISPCEVSSLNFTALPEDGSQRSGRITDENYSLGRWEGENSAVSSNILRKIGTSVTVGRRILGMRMPSTCSNNCSYTVNFNGPALKCTDEDWKSQDAAWDPLELSNGFPNGYHHYFSNKSSNGDLWTVYANQKQEERVYSKSGIPLRPSYDLSPERKDHYTKCFKCSLYNATYNVNIDSTNGIETVTYELSNVAKFIPANPLTRPATDRVDIPNYEQLAYFAYNDYFTAEKGPFRGEIREYHGYVGGFEFDTDIIFTNLVTPWLVQTAGRKNSTQNFPVDNLREGFEELSHNLTISVLSRSYLVISSDTMTMCTSHGYRNVYRYRPTQLYVSYGPLMVFSLVVVVLGLRATLKNGDVCQWGFSQIMLTTRNPSLDEMGKGSCFGVVHSGPDLHRHRLRFGELRCNADVESKIRHAAFGLEEEVVDLSAERMYS